MRTVCVNTQWASVRREGRVLLVAKKDAPPTRFRVSDLDQLVLMGNITLTPSALDLIMEKGVDTVFLTSTGRYRGRILSGTSFNVTLRLAQFEKLRNGSAFPMARAIVMGKCNNSRVFLQRFIRRHGPTPHLDSAVRAISAATARAQLASTSMKSGAVKALPPPPTSGPLTTSSRWKASTSTAETAVLPWTR